MQAKRPPPLPNAQKTSSLGTGSAGALPPTATATSSSSAHHNNGKATAAADKWSEEEDVVAAHFAALRADEGISWDRQARSVLIDSALSLAVYVVSAVVVANALRINISGILAIGGFSGVAVGFAAQRCVANMISGALIFLTQPFKVGDRVATATTVDPSTGGPFEGVVMRIGWHSTVLESVSDGSVLIVPNGDMGTMPVRNLSRRGRTTRTRTINLSTCA